MSFNYDQLKNTADQNQTYRPIFYRLNNVQDKQAFDELASSDKVVLYDEIYNQLKELIKSRNPGKRISDQEYESLIAEHINHTDIFNYGVWIFYPWSGRVVHLLDEQEFIELRTSANRNKISIAERDILAAKKVGVIGLSVGQSVAVTLAMERTCGELRLADFDTLELNNLNRIRTGLHNLGLKKAYSVAREIAELDPYFKTVCFTDGVTESNIDGFFAGGGKLDAVIDECDSVDVKILCRIKAKELNVPVLMEASDRGTMDVERFDLEPDRPIMHGWLEHLSLDFDVLRSLKTNDEKLPYMLPIAGFDTLSPRLKASVLEMSVTITTWPQLATAVTLGGALTADTCRRIFLDQFTSSGRYFIDLEKLVPDERYRNVYQAPVSPKELTREDIKDIISKIDPASLKTNGPIDIDKETLEFVVGKAITAPSLHNLQPWKWHYDGNALYLFHEASKSAPYLDFQNIASYISLGAAMENLEIAASQKGLGIESRIFPLENDNRLVASIQFVRNEKASQGFKAGLAGYIESRCTNRAIGTGEKIADNILNELQEVAAAVAGVKLIVKESKEAISALSNVIGPSERLKMLIDESHHSFYNAINWDEEKQSDEGLDVATLGLSGAEMIGFKIAQSPEVIQLSREWNGGRALEYTARKALATTSAVGIMLVPDLSPQNCLLAGRAIQDMWLILTKNNISVYPFQSLITTLARAKHNRLKELPENLRHEADSLIANFRSLIPEMNDNDAIFLFTMNTCTTQLPRSQKKRVSDILI